MSRNTPKVYAPMSAKCRDTSAGQFFSLSFNAEKMKAFIAQHTNAKGYVNLNMGKRREEGKYGETHSITLDTWEPKSAPNERQEQRREEPPRAQVRPADEPKTDDLPY